MRTNDVYLWMFNKVAIYLLVFIAVLTVMVVANPFNTMKLLIDTPATLWGSLGIAASCIFSIMGAARYYF